MAAIIWTNLKNLCIELGRLDESLISNILSGSPLLETLKLQDCGGFCGIDITSKSVKNLVIAGYRDDWDVFEINGPHILSLTIKNKLSSCIHKVVLLNVSSLVEAKIDYCQLEHFLDEPTSEQDKGEMLKGLILSLCHVKKLKIGDYCVETLARLEAKGFTFPSNMEHPKLPAYVSSSESEHFSDNDSTKSEDCFDNDSKSED